NKRKLDAQKDSGRSPKRGRARQALSPEPPPEASSSQFPPSQTEEMARPKRKMDAQKESSRPPKRVNVAPESPPSESPRPESPESSPHDVPPCQAPLPPCESLDDILALFKDENAWIATLPEKDAIDDDFSLRLSKAYDNFKRHWFNENHKRTMQGLLRHGLVVELQPDPPSSGPPESPGLLESSDPLESLPHYIARTVLNHSIAHNEPCPFKFKLKL
ncbi:hypothetical protein BGX34_007268, partial [Mortierella sp. NVP85]